MRQASVTCSVSVQGVAVVQQAAGGLGGAVAGGRTRRHLDVGARRWLVAVDEAQGLIDGVQDLDGPDDDAAVGVAAHRALAGVAETGLAGGLADRGRQPASADREAGERAGEVAASVERSRGARWSAAAGSR